MAKPKGSPKSGGRKKGTRNKDTVAKQAFLSAWEKCADSKTAETLMKAALEEAIGKKIVRKSILKNGDIVEETVIIRDFHPLSVLLPYVAQKMPQAVEASGPDGGPIILRWAGDRE